MKRNSDFMLRNIAGEVVLVPTGQATQQFNGLITLNEVAAFIWKNLDEAGTREQLVKMILDEFEVDQKTAEADVDGFINALKIFVIINSSVFFVIMFFPFSSSSSFALIFFNPLFDELKNFITSLVSLFAANNNF